MAFTHLHVHTEYSLLDGSNKVADYVKRVKELGMNSAAITDHGVMYGAIQFYVACRKEGINPIIGCEVYVAPQTRFDKDPHNKYYHLILLAENNKGYENLVKLVSQGFVDGMYYNRPRIDFDLIQKYHEGLICLSRCIQGEVAVKILAGNYQGAKETALRYQETFGKDNYFLELQDHQIPAQKAVNQGLMRLSEETGIELVATNDVHYTNIDDSEAQQVLVCIQTGKKLSDEDKLTYEPRQFYVRSEQEMRDLFPYAQQAIDNTQKIADRCHITIPYDEDRILRIPRYDAPDGMDSEVYLRQLCDEGFKERYPEDKFADKIPEYRERLLYELGVISQMGYVNYFLIVWDFINYAKSQDIPVGPGRGSAAGSMVSYCIHITEVDPMEYELYFERFLNPSRVSMPDIDIDFCTDRRIEVIDYVRRKYGDERVVQIITQNRMKAKSAFKDVARVLDIPFSLSNQITKTIPARNLEGKEITLPQALEISPELKELYDLDSGVKEAMDMAMKLEGLPRQPGIHAAGVVICPERADNYLPLQRSAEGIITTEYDKDEVEKLGLLKMDFLALRNLTVIKNTVDNIKKSKGIDLDINKIDINDKALLDFIGTGKTDGVFQIESPGMKEFMKELKPNSIADVIAGISLYRPGPMDFIPDYIRGKEHPETIKYLCPQLEPILANTYGVIVYQEQVMQIVRDLAGFSMGQSDELRKAMSKKKEKIMEMNRQSFVYGNKESGIVGCQNNGIDPAVANQVYDRMIDFAQYAFNKSHAAAYAMVTFQTAFLKYYYKEEYMAALITSVIDNPTKVSEYIKVAKEIGIKIVPPDINTGDVNFVAYGNEINYSLLAIKNIGEPVIRALVEEREANGPYTDLEDFIDRMDGNINKRAVQNFIKAGVFDSFGYNRRELMEASDIIMDSLKKEKDGNKKNMAGQMSLFDFGDDELKNSKKIAIKRTDDYSKEQKLFFEKEVLGIYLSGHPLEDYEEIIKKNITNSCGDFAIGGDDEESEDDNPDMVNVDDTIELKVKHNDNAVVGGIITKVDKRMTKRGEQMATIVVEDLEGSVDVLVFPKTYQKCHKALVEDNKVFVYGRVSVEDNNTAKINADNIVSFDDMPKKLWLSFDTDEQYKDLYINRIAPLIKRSIGNNSLNIFIRENKQVMKNPSIKVGSEDWLMDKLKEILGDDNVVLRE